jgi:hypothetical protein
MGIIINFLLLNLYVYEVWHINIHTDSAKRKNYTHTHTHTLSLYFHLFSPIVVNFRLFHIPASLPCLGTYLDIF